MTPMNSVNFVNARTLLPVHSVHTVLSVHVVHAVHQERGGEAENGVAARAAPKEERA